MPQMGPMVGRAVTLVIEPQLIHADTRGFLAIPPEDEEQLLEAASFMDANECGTIIAAARESAGLSRAEIVARLNTASQQFVDAAHRRFRRHAEW